MDTLGTNRIYYGYYLVGAAFVAQFVSIGMYSYVLGSFMTPMIEELGWSRADFTLTRTIGQLVMAFVGVFVGSRIDRFGGRPIMLIGATILAVALAAHSLVNSLLAWLILNGVVLTVGCAMIGNLVVNVTLSKWFVINRGKAVAWAAMGVSFGGIVLTPLATWLIDTQGWREAWLWLALFAAVFLYPVALMIRRAPEDHGLHPDGLTMEEVADGGGEQAAREHANAYTRREALHTLTFYALVIAFGFFSINIIVLILQTIPYLTDNGFTRVEGATAMFVASIPAMASKPVWGYLIDRTQVKPLAAISASVTGLALFMIVGAVATQELLLIYFAYVVLGLGWGGMIPMQEVIWARFFGRKHIGAIRGAGLPFSLLLGAIAPWAVSYYHDVVGVYDGALLVVATLNVFSGVLIFLVPPPKKRVTGP
ncbi:MAG: MFS transporter [Pseudomonadales bacterium]|nr:MFS transporter [Pseudomonadales bacterium]